MEHVRPDDKDATLGLDQSYRPLHIRSISVGGYPAMQSLWRPDADQLAELNAGGVVVLNILGTSHPPVLLDVHPSPFSAGGK
jgi:hypothetical protein